MMDLDDEARALLELARDAHDPSDHDRARVQAALAARLGAAAGLGLAAGLGSATKAAAGSTAGVLGAGLAAKALGMAVLVSVTVGVGATAIRTRHGPVAHVAVRKPSLPNRTGLAPAPVAVPPVTPAPAKVRAEPMETPRAAPLADVTVHKSAPPAAVLALATAPVAAAAPVVAARDRGAVVAVGLPAASPARGEVPAPVGRFGVADEAHLIHVAVAALRSGQASQALALFDTHALLYPHGVLAEERDAERALALAALGRVPEARAAIDQFLSAHPASPLAARLRDRLRDLAAGD